MKTVFLFPGQGSQKDGMLHTLPAADPIVKEVFAVAEEILGISVLTLDTAEKLCSTVNVQLCLLIIEVISAKQLLAKGLQPDFVAGHSVGAFSAAVISGVFSFKEAVQLVLIRGTLMEKAYPEGYGMAAIVGFSLSRLHQYIDQHNAAHHQIYLSNINSSDQQVVAGKIESLSVLINTLEQAGVRKAQLLTIAVPSHCVLMEPVSIALKAQMEKLDFMEPAIPYASNHTGRLLKNADAIKEDLWKSVAATVKWYDATTLIYELGARLFIEVEPSGVLTKLAAAAFPEAQVAGVEEKNKDTVVWLWNNHFTG